MKLLLIVLLALVQPVSVVQAKSADEVRKRAFAELVKRSSPGKGRLSCLHCYNGSIFCPHCISAAKDIYHIGQISKLKNISCLRGSYLSTVFDFTLRVTGEPDQDISVIVPASYIFDKRIPIPKPFIKIVSKNANEPVTQLAQQAAFRESGAVMMVAGAEGDGTPMSSKSIDMYTLPVNTFTYDAAKKLCSETNADKLLAIAKRHKLIE